MIPPRKKDASHFEAIIADVEGRLDQSRRWWTNYVFHFTAVENAVKILKSGSLLSRKQVDKEDSNFVDSASPEIIGQTEERWKDFVRFYFRPRTPTLYHNEGFRPTKSQTLHAHCPIPIYLLFDFHSVITLADSEFSIGTLAGHTTQTYKTAEDFANFPFDYIYHDNWFTPEDRNCIISARQAEVIYPQRINLQYLKLICCRSQAEYETLRNLLSTQIWNDWKDRIKVIGHQPVFFKKWLYIDQITLRDDNVILKFNLPEDDPIMKEQK